MDTSICVITSGDNGSYLKSMFQIEAAATYENENKMRHVRADLRNQISDRTIRKRLQHHGNLISNSPCFELQTCAWCGPVSGPCEHRNESCRFVRSREFIDHLNDYKLF
jgi:hypothetical protein